MIKNVVFDIGRVLLDYDGYGHVKRKLKDGADWLQVAESMFGNELWPEALDRGERELEEVITILAARSSFPEQLKLCAYSINEMYRPIQSSIEVAKYVKEKGYGLYIISNFMRHSIEEFLDKYDFFNLFDGLVISCYEGLLKPEVEIYELFLKRYECLPEECLFIDDKPENLLTARNMGFRTILFSRKVDLLDRIKKVFWEVTL